MRQMNYMLAPGLILGYKQQGRTYRQNMIIAQVYEYLDVPMTTMQTKNRKRPYVEARQISMFFLRKLTDLSLLEIGKIFNGKDHTTVIHSIETVNDLISVDEEYRKKIEHLSAIL
jgi:chromosomal replication initiation ATPase DnaA